MSRSQGPLTFQQKYYSLNTATMRENEDKTQVIYEIKIQHKKLHLKKCFRKISSS